MTRLPTPAPVLRGPEPETVDVGALAPPRPPSAAPLLLLSVVAGVAWGGGAAVLGYRLGWLAPGMGLAVGVMVRDLGAMLPSRKRRLVFPAVAIMLLVGRVSVVTVGGLYVSRAEVEADRVLLFDAALAEARAGEPKVEGEPPWRYEVRVEQAARSLMARTPPGEQRAMVQRYVGSLDAPPHRAQTPARWLVWTDFVWWPLAFAAAWRVVRDERVIDD